MQADCLRNLFTVGNLAIVYAPNILRPRVETIEVIIGDSQSASNIMLTFIKQYDMLFKKHIDKIETYNVNKLAAEDEKAQALKEELSKKYARFYIVTF